MRRFVCPVCEARAKWAVKAPSISSNGNPFGFPVALFQLLFLKPPDFLVLTFGDGSQRQDFRPVDPILAGYLQGALVSRQFQHLVSDLQPIPCRQLAEVNLLEKLTKECTNTGHQDPQMINVTSLSWDTVAASSSLQASRETGSRTRLISQLLLLNEILPARSSGKARNLLKLQLEAFGDLRDTHVQQIFFQEQVPKFPDLAHLLARLERRERSLVRRASRKIDQFKTKKLEKSVYSISQLIENQSHRVPREIAGIALQSANAAFADVMERWRLIDRSDLRTIHRTRVAYKRFRCIVESLPSELTGLSKTGLRRLARYQRAMGNIQDFEVILACVMNFRKRHETARLDSFCGYMKGRRARAVRSFLSKSNRLLQLWAPVDPLEVQCSVGSNS